MSLKLQIEKDIKAAMLAKNQGELLALRSIKSAILLAETEKGAEGDLSDDKELAILSKAAKQRKDSADVFTSQGRIDLAEKENFELDIINKYLPAQLSEEEMASEVAAIISETGASGMADMGKVMGMANKKLAGRADGKTLSTIVRNQLNS